MARYDIQATAARMPTEKYLADRLRRTVGYSATRPLYFDDTERNELEHLTGGAQLDTARDALTRIRHTTSVHVGDVTVTIPPQVLSRIASRAGAFRQPVEKWLERELSEALERSAGMRP